MAARKQLYDDAVKKGGNLQASMNEHPSKTTHNLFDNSTDISAYGWVTTKLQTEFPSYESGPIFGLLNDFNLHVDAAHNQGIKLEHKDSKMIDSKIYDATNGHYDQTYNLQNGSIFVHGLFSPTKAVERRGRVPVWAKLAADDEQRRDLKRVVHINITSDDTRDVIGEVLARLGMKEEDLKYPGKVFANADDGDHFKALLGTPNGSSTAYMVAQRKDEQYLGWKVIESISIFSCSGGDLLEVQWMMVLNIGKHTE